jgi:amyloid beta precursor protein binding protein 1
MKAQSSVYIKLQNLYKAKARKDAEEVLATVRAIPGGENIDAGEVDLFCKNARFIKLINPGDVKPPSLAQVIGTNTN